MSESLNPQTALNPYMDDPLLTASEGAEYLKVKLTTFNTWRRERKFPCVRICADARFRRSDLNKFAEDHLTWGWMRGTK